ncbi:hypothetical protein NONO_c17560 [Nocardia nova SH22a]|uniref:Uncharacterized protein n=1 Tax=Nocardia nova SH22a TaxID=1415166 RepID=W5TH31_9NOCA|nr:hypothetical protein [Nocardia nova]AHH16556.1 hypothetical protein NONO_c17560 [Nocardia nova SH22a]
MTAIQDTAREIAERTRITITVTKQLGITITADSALARVAADLMQDATDARTRAGIWSGERTTEQIEAALWRGSVAHDAVTNTHRPSTGLVGDYIRALIAGGVS